MKTVQKVKKIIECFRKPFQKQTDEERLKAVLSQMEGVGKTEVMITYESGVELVPAFESSRQETVTTGSSQSSTTVSENNQLVTVYGSGGNQARFWWRKTCY